MFFHLMADDWHPSKQLWILPNPAMPSRPILQASSRFVRRQQQQGYGTQNINFLFVLEWWRWGWRNEVHRPGHFDSAQKGMSARSDGDFRLWIELRNCLFKPRCCLCFLLQDRALVCPSVLNDDPNSSDMRMYHEAKEVIKGTNYSSNHWSKYCSIRTFRLTLGSLFNADTPIIYLSKCCSSPIWL